MSPATKKAFTVRVLDQMPKDTPGAYNEALMELGALVCIPGTPHCATPARWLTAAPGTPQAAPISCP